MKRVLVACSASNWFSPARLPKVLKGAGLEVHALASPRHALASTRYVDRVFPAPTDLEEYVQALRTHVEAQRPDWVLITDDPLLTALASRRHERWVRHLLPITNEWAAALASKADFCTLGRAARLPIPATRVCNTIDDAHAALIDLGAPMILKESSGFAGLGVRLVRETSELAVAWDGLTGTIIAQRFVEGPIGNSVVLFHRGTPMCWMSAYKVRTWPGPFGPSSARRFMTHPDVAPILRRIGLITGYHGFCAIDWVHADDRLQLIELNARPVPTIHMGPLAGVDFSRAARALIEGRIEVQEPPDPPGDAPIHPMFPEDIYRAASEGALALPIRDVPWRDPRLLLHHLRLMLRS
jgi:glutathione synthase/RimK-type ligase-like ATP-grasp enzyme